MIKMDMAVIARMDPHATWDNVHQAHPDWIAVDADADGSGDPGPRGHCPGFQYVMIGMPVQGQLGEGPMAGACGVIRRWIIHVIVIVPERPLW